jgi:hypothetical protein
MVQIEDPRLDVPEIRYGNRYGGGVYHGRTLVKTVRLCKQG